MAAPMGAHPLRCAPQSATVPPRCAPLCSVRIDAAFFTLCRSEHIIKGVWKFFSTV